MSAIESCDRGVSSSRPQVWESTALVRVFDQNYTSVISAPGVKVDPVREVAIQALYAQSPAVTSDVLSLGQRVPWP